jgi:hypothetical protein
MKTTVYDDEDEEKHRRFDSETVSLEVLQNQNFGYGFH